MPNFCSSNPASFRSSLWRKSKPFTTWLCASTRLCSDSHPSPPRCGKLRMHLKLRRKTRSHRARRATNDPQPCRKCLIILQLYQSDTRRYRAVKLAADVHPYAAENCSEISVLQKKILIVDDSPAQVKLMQGLLETEGYQPIGINDPRRVEEAITAERPSLILLDVIMPERNGFQICRELKSNALFNSIPVIMVTSKDSVSDKYWGEQQGADGYVTKPFTRDELLRAVRRFA